MTKHQHNRLASYSTTANRDSNLRNVIALVTAPGAASVSMVAAIAKADNSLLAPEHADTSVSERNHTNSILTRRMSD
jgi:hypothetical protein